MKVSIVVPVYNVPPPLLADCLSAVGRQTLRSGDYEILIIDDASTDGAVADLVERFAATHDNCRLLRHETNRGLNRARLTGVQSSRAEFVLFVDGDDVLTRDAAELLYLEAVRANADIVTAPMYRWSAETLSYDKTSHQTLFPQELPNRVRAAFSGEYSWTMCGRLFRRSLLGDRIFEMPASLPHEDLITIVRALLSAYRMAAVGEPVYYYTINEVSITRRFTSSHVDGLFYALNDWVRQAHERNMTDELELSLQQGAERLVNTLVVRCIRSNDLSFEDKVAALAQMDRRYDCLQISRPEPIFPGTKTLETLGSSNAKDLRTKVRRVVEGPVEVAGGSSP